MPLDAASHLASQGWGGAGKPLRAGPNALARPIVGVQKKTLGGVGKDRDDAFAFWDHVYAVSAQTIKIKVHNDSDTDEEPTTSASSSPPPPQIDRTSTGLISNRRPTGLQTPLSTSTSGSSTPVASDPSPSAPRLSVMTAAKKQAVRLELYRRFYVGPVIGPDHDESEPRASSSKEDGGLSTAESSEAETPSASTSEPSSTILVDELDAEAERKAAKAAKKAAREAKRQRKEEKKRRKAEKAAAREKDSKKAGKEKQKHRDGEVGSEMSCTDLDSEKTNKKRKRDGDEEEVGASTDTKGRPVSPARKKKRVKLIMSNLPPIIKHTPSLKPCEKKGILRTPAADPCSTKEQSGSDGEKGKKVTFTKTVISHTVARWWEEAGWSDDGI